MVWRTGLAALLFVAGVASAATRDEQEVKAAYVLNFTPRWSPDWGGILNFIDRDGHVAEGYTPAFNALNVFRVPQLHSVSCVSPYAQAGRYSITGWLRER